MQLANLTACEEPLTRALVLDLPVEPHAATAAATAKPTVTGQIEAWTRPRRQQPARRARRDRRLGGITALVIRPRVVVATCMCTLCGAADNTAVTPRMAVVCRRGRNQRTRRRPGETAHRRMFGFDGERSPQDRNGGDRSARKPPVGPKRFSGARHDRFDDHRSVALAMPLPRLQLSCRGWRTTASTRRCTSGVGGPGGNRRATASLRHRPVPRSPERSSGLDRPGDRNARRAMAGVVEPLATPLPRRHL